MIERRSGRTRHAVEYREDVLSKRTVDSRGAEVALEERKRRRLETTYGSTDESARVARQQPQDSDYEGSSSTGMSIFTSTDTATSKSCTGGGAARQSSFLSCSVVSRSGQSPRSPQMADC
ncbi:hypothetical protein WJX84_010122 [Apatococcus fuscideae]|uniref:Uncharacterized protein n=1 Tax=Apatococcus fuscideae TaxID=2026836 RepID=A0AAW1T392_9CHLO